MTLRRTVTAAQIRKAWAVRPNQASLSVSTRWAATQLGATYLAVAHRASEECRHGRAGLSGPTTDSSYQIIGA